LFVFKRARMIIIRTFKVRLSNPTLLSLQLCCSVHYRNDATSASVSDTVMSLESYHHHHHHHHHHHYKFWLYCPLLCLGRFFRFLIIYTVSRTPWTGDQPVARPLPPYRTIQTQKKRTQTSMPPVGFEATIPAFERAKTVHALDRAATVIGTLESYWIIFPEPFR
jgi:hypothetical protein